jgi:hypothetical protein
MGAMLRFKEQTGKEITEMDGSSFTDQVVYLYCCVKSACAREKKPFEMSLIEFADSIEQDEMANWLKNQEGDAQESGKGEDAPKA